MCSKLNSFKVYERTHRITSLIMMTKFACGWTVLCKIISWYPPGAKVLPMRAIQPWKVVGTLMSTSGPYSPSWAFSSASCQAGIIVITKVISEDVISEEIDNLVEYICRAHKQEIKRGLGMSRKCGNAMLLFLGSSPPWWLFGLLAEKKRKCFTLVVLRWKDRHRKGGPQPDLDSTLRKINPEGSCPDRSVSFLFYSSTTTNPTVSSSVVHFANWMKCVQKCQKIAGC